jgi:RNA polymerase sigma factor (sigma-70 family)
VDNPEPVRHPALEQLISRYAGLVRAAVSRVAGPLTDQVAEDVEQRVAVALWRAMPGEQIPRHPASYLYRAAVRETVRALRSRHDAGRVELVEEVRDPSPSPDTTLESKELGMAIRDALSKLVPARRRAVQAHLMGFDVREIMDSQGWSYNRARNLIARGMADLRRELEKRGVHG